jgi:Fe-Mn family superoxide dismutase
MDVEIKYEGCNPTKEEKTLINRFIDNLKKSYPLNDNVTIVFQTERSEKMSTGVRTNKHKLKILVKDRLNRDILRTVAHEWVHEYQRNVLKRKRQKDVGSKNENEANAKSGEEVKKFEKSNKNLEKTIYSKFSEEISRIESVLNEETPSNRKIISEIKKISIEKLPYDYDSLGTFIDGETMKTHYNKHYKGYVEKLNSELDKIKGKDLDLEEIIKKISKFGDKVKNNGGGAFNHALFWKMLSPKKQTIKDPILSKINKQFGSIDKFKEKFEGEAKTKFGSGWVWLILTKNNTLKIVTTSNQDNPLMDTEKNNGYPLLGLDLWEHAYYLKYKNERDKYIHNFWKVINWEFINDLYIEQTKKKLNESILSK